VVNAIKLANLKIHDEAERNSDCRGMGTTVVAALFADGVLVVGHVGDSRLYRLRGGRLDQMTEDHSLLNDYVKMKRLSAGEKASFPHKNVIVRALGMKPSVEVDIIVDEPRLGDLYLLCTDGLSGMVPDEEIVELAASETDLDKLCERLVAAANAHGGLDNITVVCARLEPL
jgi:protein phosphatase